MAKYPPKLTFLIPINPNKITSLLPIHKSLGEQLTLNINPYPDILSLQRNSLLNNLPVNTWQPYLPHIRYKMQPIFWFQMFIQYQTIIFSGRHIYHYVIYIWGNGTSKLTRRHIQ